MFEFRHNLARYMNVKMQYSIRYLVGITAILAVLFAAILAARNSFGHRVTVKNLGDKTIRKVVVLVTGNKYELEEILPNQSRTIVVRPRGDSDVRIEYIDESSNNQVIEVGRYLEPNTWPETISVNIPASED